MEKYLGTVVRVTGHNVTETNCVECGRKLNQREWVEGSEHCMPCRKKKWNSGRNRNKNVLGENRIDDILVNKIEKR